MSLECRHGPLGGSSVHKSLPAIVTNLDKIKYGVCVCGLGGVRGVGGGWVGPTHSHSCILLAIEGFKSVKYIFSFILMVYV